MRDIDTPLFDPQGRSNPSKISHVIRQAFAGKALAIPTELQSYVTQAPLTDLLEFGRVEFDAGISVTPKKTTALVSKWPIHKLDTLVTISRGASPRPIRDYLTTANEGVNWIKIGDVAAGEKYITQTEEKITLAGASQSRFVRVGDFILSNSMSFGRPYILKIDGCVHDGWLLLTNLPKSLHPDYLYEILGSPETQKQFQQQAGGGVVQNLNVDRVSSVLIPLPPLNIQQTIVAECEAVDLAVEEAKAHIEQQLQQLNRSLEEAAHIRPKDKLTNIAQRISDSIDPQQHTGPVNYFGLENIESHTGQKTGTTTSTYSAIKSTKTCFKAGDVLYGKLRPNLNKVLLATEDGICSTDIYVLRFPNAALAHIFVHYLRSQPFNEAVLKTVSGQQLPRTSWTAMGQIPVPVFTAAQQTALGALVADANHAIAAAMTTIASAAAKKQAILQKYL